MIKTYPKEEKQFITWLQPDYLKESFIQKAHTLFAKNIPFPHAVFTNFLLKDNADALRTALLQETFTEKNSDLFSLHQTNDLHSSSNPLLQSFIQLLESSAFRAFLTQMTGMQFAQTIDISGSIYAPTNYLLPHDDLLEGRTLAFSYYLTPGFTVRDGGDLQLFSSRQGTPEQIVKRYQALFNSFIIFKVTENSFHQVAEVVGEKQRLALSGWFHAQR